MSHRMPTMGSQQFLGGVGDGGSLMLPPGMQQPMQPSMPHAMQQVPAAKKSKKAGGGGNRAGASTSPPQNGGGGGGYGKAGGGGGSGSKARQRTAGGGLSSRNSKGAGGGGGGGSGRGALQGPFGISAASYGMIMQRGVQEEMEAYGNVRVWCAGACV